MTHLCDDELVMLADLTIKPEKLDEFLDYTTENLALSRAAAGNIAFDILLDQSNPCRVIFHEVWQSAEAQQTYMAWRIERGDLTILMSFLAAEPKFTSWQRLAS